MTGTVQSWVNGTYTNHGFKLHENGNNHTFWKRLISASGSALSRISDGGLVVGYRVHRQLPLMTYYWEAAVQVLGPAGWQAPTTFSGTDATLEELSLAADDGGVVLATQSDGRLERALHWTEGFGGRECPYLADHHGAVIWHGVHGAGQVVLGAVASTGPAASGGERAVLLGKGPIITPSSPSRMSGTAEGTIVLHVMPEAAIGGPLEHVRNGDRIRLSVARTIAFLYVPSLTRVVRANVLEILSQEFVGALHAKGLLNRRVLYHTLKNAAPSAVLRYERKNAEAVQKYQRSAQVASTGSASGRATPRATSVRSPWFTA